MGTCPWKCTLAMVALLLDPTLADILVQPGYGQPGKSPKDSVVKSQSLTSQSTVKSQQNYYPQQDQFLQLLQHQHALQHQYLQQQHQMEHNQLLQLQHQELQNPGMRQQQVGGQEIVGTPFLRPHMIAPGPFGGAFGGSKLFSLGPLGLNSFSMRGLGGMGMPVLLSPQHQGQMTASTQFQKSMDGPTQPRTRRDVRDTGDNSGKRYRQKNVRVQQDGMAANPTLKSKSDAASPNIQTSKMNDQTVGDAHNGHEETVGSSLLDPLGLLEKTEDLMEDLKSGKLPNPLGGLTNGGHLPGWLNKENSETPQFEEHVVSQPQQYSQYPTQGKYNMMNQQPLAQSQQSAPVVGDPRHRPYPPPGYFGPPGPFGPQGVYGQQGIYYRPQGIYSSPYPYRPSLPPQFLLRSAMQPNSMNIQGNRMAYGGGPMTAANNPSVRQPNVQTNVGNPMTGSANPGVKTSMANSNGYQKMTGAQNPASSKSQTLQAGSGGSGQSSPMNSVEKDQIVGAPNPQATLGNPGGFQQMVGSPNPVDSLYQLAKMAQPMMGTLLNPMTGGGSTPYNYQPGAGNPMMKSFYDPAGQMNYYRYNDGQQMRSPFDLEDLYDTYGDRQDYMHHHHHHGGYDRFQEAIIDDGPFGFGGGRPHYVHNHEGYIF